MRSRARTAALAATAVVTAAAAAAPAATAGELYLQQAGGGTLSARTLVLREVGPRVTSFADRPRRSAGSETTRAFVKNWGRSFGDDAPNAALEIEGAPRGRDVAIVELRRPRYDARARTLTFAIRAIAARAVRGDRSALAGYAARADRHARITSFGRATLFVDAGADTVPAVVAFTIPPGASAGVTLSNATFAYDAEGIFLADILTPPSVNQNGVASTSVGAGQLSASTIRLQASTGPGGGVQTDFIAGIELPADGSAVTGTATLPAGATLTIAWPGQSGQTIANGAFTLTQPAG